MFIKRQCILFFVACLFSAAVFANEIELFDQPKAEAKVIGKIPSKTGFVCIYTPKDSEWIKVGDPRNGHVGWVKLADAKKSGFASNRLMVKNDGQSFQLVQYAAAQPYDDKQTKEMLDLMQKRQIAFQKHMQKVMSEMMSDPFFNPPESKV